MEPEGFLLPGDTIGRFCVRDILGTGSAGVVYLARDTASGEERAVKVLAPEIAEGARQELISRLYQEAAAAGALRHPNIIPLCEVGEHNGLPFLVMEYRRAPTLARRLRQGPLPIPEAVALVRQLASALAETHARGIIHRDLKPTNILYDARGHATLIDFGIARLRNSALTRAGVIMGSLGYCAPEQVQFTQPLDHRADLFALGILFYVVLTGRRPFPTDSMERYAEAVLSEAPTPPAAYVPALPAALNAIILRLLEKDPDARVPDAGALLRALDEAGL